MAPQGLVATQDAWSRYIKDASLDFHGLRSEVANSWQRCRRSRLDPFRGTDSGVNVRELRERLYRKQNLIKVARSCISELYGFVKGSGFQVVLADEFGFLLEVLGDNEIISKTRGIHLCPGGDWSEATNGTNAIGTAIVEGKPVQIHATEHYCEHNHFLTCSAAPIFDSEGSIVGVLDMSGDYRFANAHTLGMVVAAANAIEAQLRLQQSTNKLRMAHRYSEILAQNMSDGILSIDNNGFVAELNAKGGEIFGVNPALAKGRHLAKMGQARLPILQAMSEGREYDNKEIILDKTGRKIYSSASLLHDEGGSVVGAVAVFRENDNRSQHVPRRPMPPKSNRYTFEEIIGDSPSMLEVKQWAKLAAASPSTVLIDGESGTGKELFAQAIHNASPRKDRPFIAINCAALPENLIESELFGYEEGAFTGARKGGYAGKFEVADGGTIFLDEIGDMSLSVQTKLLRVIQEKKVARIGSASERPIDIRIIAATHKDLNAEVLKGHFRQDLYYRLNVLQIRIPSLRERADDIPALTRHLAQKIAARFNRDSVEIHDDFLKKLQSYSWPGNIRELENTIERAIIRAGIYGALTGDLLDAPSRELSRVEKKPAQIRSLRDGEREIIAQALAFFDGNIQKAATHLGIGRNTLYRKIREYGIEHRVAVP